LETESPSAENAPPSQSATSSAGLAGLELAEWLLALLRSPQLADRVTLDAGAFTLLLEARIPLVAQRPQLLDSARALYAAISRPSDETHTAFLALLQRAGRGEESMRLQQRLLRDRSSSAGPRVFVMRLSELLSAASSPSSSDALHASALLGEVEELWNRACAQPVQCMDADVVDLFVQCWSHLLGCTSGAAQGLERIARALEEAVALEVSLRKRVERGALRQGMAAPQQAQVQDFTPVIVDARVVATALRCYAQAAGMQQQQRQDLLRAAKFLYDSLLRRHSRAAAEGLLRRQNALACTEEVRDAYAALLLSLTSDADSSVDAQTKQLAQQELLRVGKAKEEAKQAL